MTDPNLSAQTAETDLRELARLVLEPALGPDWVERAGIFTPEQIVKVKGRRSTEEEKRGGAVVEQSLIYYVDLWDLISMTKKHWTKFKKVLGPNKERWNQESQVLYNIRNAQAHGRALVPFERDLLSGIAGDIRNRVTRFRSNMNDRHEWWPRVESITDSFGTTVNPDTSDFLTMKSTNLLVEVGQTVTFQCSGWDPHGRTLSWRINDFNGPALATGTDVSISHTITHEEFGSEMFTYLYMTADAPVHKGTFFDVQVCFVYEGRPPGV